MTGAVALPLVLLALAAWGVPWLLSKMMPEGVFWLALVGMLAAMILSLGAAAGFYVIYGAAGDKVLATAPWHFMVLSAKAAIVWGPVMVLSLANVPSGWKEAVW